MSGRKTSKLQSTRATRRIKTDKQLSFGRPAELAGIRRAHVEAYPVSKKLAALEAA